MEIGLPAVLDFPRLSRIFACPSPLRSPRFASPQFLKNNQAMIFKCPQRPVDLVGLDVAIEHDGANLIL
jgi:hypothetical protein